MTNSGQAKLGNWHLSGCPDPNPVWSDSEHPHHQRDTEGPRYQRRGHTCPPQRAKTVIPQPLRERALGGIGGTGCGGGLEGEWGAWGAERLTVQSFPAFWSSVHSLALLLSSLMRLLCCAVSRRGSTLDFLGVLRGEVPLDGSSVRRGSEVRGRAELWAWPSITDGTMSKDGSPARPPPQAALNAPPPRKTQAPHLSTCSSVCPSWWSRSCSLPCPPPAPLPPSPYCVSASPPVPPDNQQGTGGGEKGV